jgi:hypothetical protein
MEANTEKTEVIEKIKAESDFLIEELRKELAQTNEYLREE